jgi:hypothetical protein
MSNLYQDAILDAKALRASAMANAKAALEEAFEPRIQEMMRLKLSEEFDTLEEDNVNPADIADAEIEDESVSPVGMEENIDINEAELEEILAELEELSKEENQSPLQEAEEAEEADEDEDSEEDAIEDDAEGEAPTDGKAPTDDTKVLELTLGDLKKVIQSVMTGAEGMDLGMDQDISIDEAQDAEITLDEILAELEMEEGMEDDINNVSDATYKSGTQHNAHPGYSELEEKKKAKYSGYSDIANAKKEKADAKDGGDLDDTAYNKLAEENELEEAKATIETLRQNLQEVNLLNAKYLYMNKLFKSKSLTESQKVKVINALDRASNVAEVKNTYETLKESFSETNKTQLKESIGFASQAAGMAPKGNIVDADPFINRWQTLAGISKRK